MEINKVYQGDCTELLKEIPDDFVDLIITSPPYNLGNDHHTGSKRHNVYDDDIPEEEYQRWQHQILNECYRVLKVKGSMIYNHKNRIKDGLQISPYVWINKSKFLIKQEIVWWNGSQNFDQIRFYPVTERLYWLVKNKDVTLRNLLGIQDLVKYKPVGTKGNHKRAYPLRMILDLVKVFPNAALILDPFAGSGTTLLAARLENRDYLGFDINPEYVALINQRLEQQNIAHFSNTLLSQPSAEGSLISVKRESDDSRNSPHDSSTIKEEANFS